MTIERRLIVGLEDIAAVVFECTSCNARVSVHPDKTAPLAGKCPRCSFPWTIFDPDPNALPANSLSKSYFTDFTEALKRIRSKDVYTVGFRLLLEFKEPE